MHPTKIIIMAATLLLSGCFPASPDLLKREASARDGVVVAEGYQSVFRKVSARLRCYESMWIGDSTRVRADLYTDIRRGELAIEGNNMLLGKRVEVLIEIAAIGDSETRVDVFMAVDRKAFPVRDWIENPKGCH